MPIIKLTRGYTTVVDQEDGDLATFKWHANRDGYTARRVGPRHAQKTVFLHQVILRRMLGGPIPAGLEPDHRDGNRRNNMRSNLRLATRSQNNTNRQTQMHTSRYRGVSWCNRYHKWAAHIQFNGQQRNLGCFTSEAAAARAYNKAAQEYHGEFARLNDLAEGGAYAADQ